MSGKVIDLDPQKRISKEALIRIQKTVDDFKLDDLESLAIIYVKKDGTPVFEAFGVDWSLLGVSQAYLEHLRWEFLNGTDETETGEDDAS